MQHLVKSAIAAVPTSECTQADTTGPALEAPAPADLCFSRSALKEATFSFALVVSAWPAKKERSHLSEER